jgi:hypothetical protein
MWCYQLNERQQVIFCCLSDVIFIYQNDVGGVNVVPSGYSA